MSECIPRFPVTPDQVDAQWALVEGGAVMARQRRNALVLVDGVEHSRRCESGLGAVTNTALLDVLMNLPLEDPVPVSGLFAREYAVLCRAPDGVVSHEDGCVVRHLSEPASVSAAVVEANTWIHAQAALAAFSNVAQRVAVISDMPTALSVPRWEADVAGIGIWTRLNGELVEVIAPAPFAPRYRKPARWRFLENAYKQWLKATHPTSSSSFAEGRRVRTADAG